METPGINHQKRLARLYYKDKIWSLSSEGKSVREIAELINRNFIPRSKFKGVTLSKSTIHATIKKQKK